MIDSGDDWCCGFYLHIYLSIHISVYHFRLYANCINPFVTAGYTYLFISWSGSVSSYQCVIHIRAWHVISVSWSIYFFFWKTLKSEFPSCPALWLLCAMTWFHQCKICLSLWFTRFISRVASCNCLNKHVVLLPFDEQVTYSIWPLTAILNYEFQICRSTKMVS